MITTGRVDQLCVYLRLPKHPNRVCVPARLNCLNYTERLSSWALEIPRLIVLHRPYVVEQSEFSLCSEKDSQISELFLKKWSWLGENRISRFKNSESKTDKDSLIVKKTGTKFKISANFNFNFTLYCFIREERCEFLPFMAPMKVITRPDGRISHLVLARTEQTDDGQWITDEEETLKKKCDFIISAFGSALNDKV